MVNYALIDRHSWSYKKNVYVSEVKYTRPVISMNFKSTIYYSWRGRTNELRNLRKMLMQSRWQINSFRPFASTLGKSDDHCNILINCRSQSDPSSCATRLRFGNIQSMILSNYPRWFFASTRALLFSFLFDDFLSDKVIEIKYHLRFIFFFIKYLFLSSQNI